MRDDSSSPDVNPDGSLADTTDGADHAEDRDWRRWLSRAGWTVEIWQRRTIAAVRTLLRAGGVILAIVGTANLLLTAAGIGAPAPAYRSLYPLVASGGQGVYYVADVVVLAVGAAIAWFV